MCAYMSESPQNKFMYTETPCYSENQNAEIFTRNNGKPTLRRASKFTISKFRVVQLSLPGVTETNEAHLHKKRERVHAIETADNWIGPHKWKYDFKKDLLIGIVVCSVRRESAPQIVASLLKKSPM